MGSGWWSDVLLLFRHKRDDAGHVCELQVALDMMILARQGMKAHESYARARHFIELTESVGSPFQAQAPEATGAQDEADRETLLLAENKRLVEENTALTNINMPNLVDLVAPEGSGNQHFMFRDNNAIEEISFPSLTMISGATVAIERNPSVTTLNFPALETACCGVNFRIKEMPELQEISFPKLKTVGSQVLIQKNAAMTKISMPELERVQEGTEGNNLAGRFKIGPDNNSLTDINLGAAVVDGNLNVIDNCALQTSITTSHIFRSTAIVTSAGTARVVNFTCKCDVQNF